MKKYLYLFFACLVLAGCGQVYDREPIGIGFDENELKLSPCACLRVWRG